MHRHNTKNVNINGTLKPPQSPFPVFYSTSNFHCSSSSPAMYGNPSRFRPSGGRTGGRWQQPSPFQSPYPNNAYIQPPQYQNQSFPTNSPVQGCDFSIRNQGFPVQQFPGQVSQPQNPRKLLEKVDRAVVKARRDLLAAGESVSVWKVSQSALLTLQVDCWGSLGFRMQQVPSLHSLIVTEGKVMS